MPTAHIAMTPSAVMLGLIVSCFLLNVCEDMRRNAAGMPPPAIKRHFSSGFYQLSAMSAALDLGVVRVLNVVHWISHALTFPQAL